MRKINFIVLIILLITSGCGLSSETQTSSSSSAFSAPLVFVTVTPTAAPPTDVIPVNITQQPFDATGAACTGTFIPHALDHTTTIAGDIVRMFDSNGSGLAINDLDNDGDLDLVLANLRGSNSILWNEGGLNFRLELLPFNNSRAATIVDVDGDGWQDIVFSQRIAPPLYLRNEGADIGSPTFTHTPLPDVDAPAYALAWGDADGDGDLDLVTGSYNAELSKELGDTFLFSDGAGVFYYENRGGHFEGLRLAPESQALTIALLDLNDDEALDILVGNDFGLPDFVWLQQLDGWQATQPFAATTHSTMSFDRGDINNDGRDELFATDMKPYREDAETLAKWQPVMEMMADHPPEAGDVQIMENVLQEWSMDGHFENLAPLTGLDATGWSWSAKFGDLDNDGFLDIYVVNGMAAQDLFGHLPDNELVEENQAFRNSGYGRFVAAPEWRLNATSGGRGMSMADLDHDGDLDIVVNNLLTPAQLFENQLCGGSSLEVDLSWSGSHNTHALGATLSLQTSTGTYYRQVKANSGYLSGDPARVHFGFPADSQLKSLEVMWPDGAVSMVTDIRGDQRLIIRVVPQ